MLKGLQKKWKVNSLQLTLILCTFAIGGSLTGFIAKKIMNVMAISQDWLWAILYIVLLTCIWPMAVLIISIPLGQYRFFLKYIKKIGEKFGVKTANSSNVNQLKSRNFQSTKPLIASFPPGEKIKVAIFASGAGSNAKKMIDHFANHRQITIALIVTDKKRAGVLQIADDAKIPSILIDKEKFAAGDTSIIQVLKDNEIHFIVLAGFLRKVPAILINTFPGKIVNIHPALLPKHGGKGMYGRFVHEAVIAADDKESGITIHYVDEQYDHGNTIFQAQCPVLENDSPEELAQRVHVLEHAHYAKVVEELLVGAS